VLADTVDESDHRPRYQRRFGTGSPALPNDMAIMGSGTIVSQLTQERLIDEYQIVVIPVVLGAGRTMFDGVKGKLGLALAETRGFGNGNVLLRYEPLG
jgi:dihydrofolate reductase